MKNKITKFFIASFVALSVYGNELDYSYTEYTQSAYHLDLTGANFEGAQIVTGNFVKTNLTRANLRDANFSGVNLEFATLTGADLTGTNFTDVRFNSQTKWPEGFDPLTIGAYGPGVDYSKREFTASAYHLDLTGANFEGAQIVTGNFVKANLTRANLRDANFSGVNLEFATLTGADLTGTNFTDVRFNLQTKWPDGFDPLTIGAYGPGVDYSKREFTASAYHLDLTGANFEGAQIVTGNFVKANLTRANLQDANFSGVNLDHANLTGADLTGTDFTDAWFNSKTKWPEGFDPLTIGAHGPGMDYSGEVFTLKASHRDLSGTNFEGARILNVSFGAVNLSNANLRNADFRGVNLEFADLTGADLRDANFSKVYLRNTTLTGADLTGTDFTDAWFNSKTKWPEGFDPLTIGAHGPGMDYSGEEFTLKASHRDLSGTNFEGARILNVSFGAVNLSNANLRNADFRGVNLEFADLTGADLRDANFSKVYLRNTTLTGADLTGTDFTDAWFNSKTKWPEGFDPLTIGAHGPGMDYSGEEFTLKASHRDLSGTNFEGARILNVSFGAVNLSNANLRNADFRGVNLNYANLINSDLRGTDLREIKYNSNTDWTGAIYSVHTQWPEGLDPRAVGAVLEWRSPRENPDGTGMVHYKQEYEKARILLDQLKKQTESAKKNLIEKEGKVSSLRKKIEEGKATLLSIKTDLSKAQTEHAEFLDGLNEANQTLVARVEKVRWLNNELAQSIAMESSLKVEVESEAYKLEEKVAQFEQVEAILAVPHLKGWHYSANQGWLFTEPGTFPHVFAEQTQSWMYYNQGTSQPWWYFNYNSQVWEDWKAE